jgi:hypothetical protein
MELVMAMETLVQVLGLTEDEETSVVWNTTQTPSSPDPAMQVSSAHLERTFVEKQQILAEVKFLDHCEIRILVCQVPRQSASWEALVSTCQIDQMQPGRILLELQASPQGTA